MVFSVSQKFKEWTTVSNNIQLRYNPHVEEWKKDKRWRSFVNPVASAMWNEIKEHIKINVNYLSVKIYLNDNVKNYKSQLLKEKNPKHVLTVNVLNGKIDFNKKTIFVVGCSYCSGLGVNPEENFIYLLDKFQDEYQFISLGVNGQGIEFFCDHYIQRTIKEFISLFNSEKIFLLSRMQSVRVDTHYHPDNLRKPGWGCQLILPQIEDQYSLKVGGCDSKKIFNFLNSFKREDVENSKLCDLGFNTIPFAHASRTLKEHFEIVYGDNYQEWIDFNFRVLDPKNYSDYIKECHEESIRKSKLFIDKIGHKTIIFDSIFCHAIDKRLYDVKEAFPEWESMQLNCKEINNVYRLPFDGHYDPLTHTYLALDVFRILENDDEINIDKNNWDKKGLLKLSKHYENNLPENWLK